MLCCLNLPYCVCSFQYRWDVQVSHVWRFCQPRRSSTSCSFELWENDELFFWALRDCECCHFSWPLPRTGGRFHRQDLPKGLWIWKASFFLPVGKETVLLKTSPSNASHLMCSANDYANRAQYEQNAMFFFFFTLSRALGCNPFQDLAGMKWQANSLWEASWALRRLRDYTDYDIDLSYFCTLMHSIPRLVGSCPYPRD